ncbi:MAG: hypothetical protein ABEJ65_05565 [bacterium]
MTFTVQPIVLFFYSLAIRFFLFEMGLFGPVRDFLRRRIPLMDKLMECAFCSGFWVGLAMFGAGRGWSLLVIPNALLVGYAAFFLRLTMKYMAIQVEKLEQGSSGDTE